MFSRLVLGIAVIAYTVLAPLNSVAAAASRDERSFDYGPADLTAYWYPLSSGTRPVVIMVHGGGWRRGSRDWLTVHARYMADHGYRVFNLDYRLRVPWPAPRDDLAAAYSWIKERAEYFGADMSKVVLFGESAGGHLVTNFGTLGRGGYRFRGVVGMSPVADPQMAYEDGTRPNASAHDKVLREAALILAGGCEPTVCPHTWQSMASKTGAGRHDPPMLLIHAVDEWVPAKHSRELCAVLARNIVPCAVTVYPGSDHAMDLWDESSDAVMSFIESVTNSAEEQV
jgi:acetyl esterase/lipase